MGEVWAWMLEFPCKLEKKQNPKGVPGENAKGDSQIDELSI
jgi:hypothetical protein